MILKSLSKSERKSVRKRSARYLKQLFAAYHFLNTSRDGAVIAQIVGAKPIELYRWSQEKSWIKALKYWQSGYYGNGVLEGEYFKSIVGDSIVKRSLDNAERLWKTIAEMRENSELRKIERLFDEIGFTE